MSLRVLDSDNRPPGTSSHSVGHTPHHSPRQSPRHLTVNNALPHRWSPASASASRAVSNTSSLSSVDDGASQLKVPPRPLSASWTASRASGSSNWDRAPNAANLTMLDTSYNGTRRLASKSPTPATAPAAVSYPSVAEPTIMVNQPTPPTELLENMSLGPPNSVYGYTHLPEQTQPFASGGGLPVMVSEAMTTFPIPHPNGLPPYHDGPTSPQALFNYPPLFEAPFQGSRMYLPPSNLHSFVGRQTAHTPFDALSPPQSHFPYFQAPDLSAAQSPHFASVNAPATISNHFNRHNPQVQRRIPSLPNIPRRGMHVGNAMGGRGNRHASISNVSARSSNHSGQRGLAHRNAHVEPFLHRAQQQPQPEILPVVGVSGLVRVRSQILEDFRANRVMRRSLREIRGHIVEFSTDQHGSRFIQQRLESNSVEDRDLIFSEIMPFYAFQLMQDVFGNYVIQKLFEHGNVVQKAQLALAMKRNVFILSMQVYGCRVVQKAIECLTPEYQAIIVSELDGHVLACVKDPNGNHVIQRIIERVQPQIHGFVQAFEGQVYDLASHPYGCRVLQRCLEHIPADLLRPLLNELEVHCKHLMQDQFGNYVIQFVLEHGRREDRKIIISKLRGSLLQMARHKCASNVCEKALVAADAEDRRMLVEELLQPIATRGGSHIASIMRDQFANYVLQRALVVSEGPEKARLATIIQSQLETMRRNNNAYSKHLASFERLLEKENAKMVAAGEQLALSQLFTS